MGLGLVQELRGKASKKIEEENVIFLPLPVIKLQITVDN